MSMSSPRTEAQRRQWRAHQNLERDRLMKKIALDWAATWIETSAIGCESRVVEFAANMAMTLRAEANGDQLLHTKLKALRDEKQTSDIEEKS